MGTEAMTRPRTRCPCTRWQNVCVHGGLVCPSTPRGASGPALRLPFTPLESTGKRRNLRKCVMPGTWAAEVYVWDCGRPLLAVQNNWKNGTDHSEMDYYHTAGYDGAAVNAVVEAAGGHAVVVDPGGSGIDYVTFFLHLDMETSVYVCRYVKDDRTGEVTARLEGGSSNVAGKIGYRKDWVKIDDISAHLLGGRHCPMCRPFLSRIRIRTIPRP